MRARKCPYCGKRISYFVMFEEKRISEHICPRCGKESKIVVKKNIFASFLVAIIISAVIAVMWIGLGYMNNPWGVVLVAIPLLISYLLSPKFIRVLPFKKYKKSMEATKAGREYSSEMKYKENLGNTVNEAVIPSAVSGEESAFTINEELFSSIKSNRKKPVADDTANDDGVSGSTVIVPGKKADDAGVSGSTVIIEDKKAENFVPIIENNREAHASSSENVPLQKIHRERPQYERPPQPFLNYHTQEEYYSPPAEKKKRQEGSKYSANRRF